MNQPSPEGPPQLAPFSEALVTKLRSVYSPNIDVFDERFVNDAISQPHSADTISISMMQGFTSRKNLYINASHLQHQHVVDKRHWLKILHIGIFKNTENARLGPISGKKTYVVSKG